MRTYELTFIIKPSVKEADRKKIVETVKGWLGKVSVVKENEWGQKALAYPIKKEESGHYYMFELEVEEPSYKASAAERKAGVPEGFEQRLVRDENILRHLLLRTN